MEIKRIGSIGRTASYLTFDATRLSVKKVLPATGRGDADWILEPLGPKDTYRIRHSIREDHYLHAETDQLACEPIHFGANSSYWILERQPTFDTYTIRNFWRSNVYIYQQGEEVLIGAVAPEALSAHWHIEDPAKNFLLTPVHLDALWLPHDQAVSAPMADFSRLPWSNGRRDINPNTPYISEAILTKAMEPPQLFLKSGLHLHWALPDALHHGVQTKEDRLHFFQAPNRWLVTKVVGEATRQWVVESNYLHPPGEERAGIAVTYPNQGGAHPQPFRYLGRKVPFSDWSETDAGGDNPNYLHDLTAIGYGEPTFATFYPNCLSVFGFYDEESAGKTIAEMKGVRYEVIGWHSTAGADVLQDQRFIGKVDELRAGHQATLATAPYRFEALKTTLGWIVEDADNTAFPMAAVYFARLTLAADAVPDPKDRRPKAVIAIGNSATEALSAHLGLEIGGNDRLRLEEQLEALQLLPELEGQVVDAGPKFREARHVQGFKAVHAGLISTIKPQTPAGGEAEAQGAPNQSQVVLPRALAGQLDALNTLRAQYDRAVARLEARQEQLFSDWYKYLVTAYPPEDARDDFPEIDEVAFFIQEHSLKEVAQQREEIAALKNQIDLAAPRLAQAVEDLQRIFVADILNWDAFRALLSGRQVPQDPGFGVVLQRLRQALPVALQALVADEAAAITAGDQVSLIAGVQTVIDADPTLLAPESVVGNLPAEARGLLAKGNASLSLAERRRLGRLTLEAALPQTLARRPPFVVDEIPAPRFWEPAEPVVLIADSELKMTDRHGEDGRLREDGLLACFLFRQSIDNEVVEDRVDRLFAAIRARIGQLQAAASSGVEGEEAAERIGFYTWRSQPWHPFMLEWEVELFPLKEGNSHSAVDRKFRWDFISRHYDFPEEGPDLTPKSDDAVRTRSANIYAGRSLMLDYARPQLIERLEAYCRKYLAPLYYDSKETPASKRLNKPPLDQITEWAQKNRDQLSPFNQAILAIQIHLAKHKTPPMGQALSGFNAALLQHKQTLQLPVDDPLGFPDARELARAVREGVGRGNRRAPQPLNDFNPLRTGALRLQHLRLVDTFGRIQTLFDPETPQELVASAPFTKLDGHTVALPPRLVQPARLDFNWLAARSTPEGGDMKMNSHPDTTPICGWLIPNYLDNSLLVYNGAGQPLGALQSDDQDGIRWEGAPGRAHRILETEIDNEHLYRLVSHLLKQNRNFLDDVLTALESALENILPESSAEHDSLSLLVGRPLAVVRACLDLEIKGLPAANQDWNRFRHSLQTHTRYSDDFTAINFPLRVGEHSRLNDGLLGFWIENADPDRQGTPYRDDKLYLPQTPDTPRTGSIDHPDLVMHRGSTTPHIQLAVDTPLQTLTMLVDPRGAVHLSSGILPVQSQRIPPELYLPAFNELELTFFSGPFLTRADGIELPVPTEPGYAWSLLTKENGAWADTHDIDPVEDQATFSTSHLIREGWLKLKKQG